MNIPEFGSMLPGDVLLCREHSYTYAEEPVDPSKLDRYKGLVIITAGQGNTRFVKYEYFNVDSKTWHGTPDKMNVSTYRFMVERDLIDFVGSIDMEEYLNGAS